MEDLGGRELCLSLALPCSLCVCVHKLTSCTVLFLGHTRSCMCQLMQFSARCVLTSRTTKQKEVLDLEGKIKTDRACLNYMTS